MKEEDIYEDEDDNTIDAVRRIENRVLVGDERGALKQIVAALIHQAAIMRGLHESVDIYLNGIRDELQEINAKLSKRDQQ